jgi:hypothetical protein
MYHGFKIDLQKMDAKDFELPAEGSILPNISNNTENSKNPKDTAVEKIRPKNPKKVAVLKNKLSKK